jgi:tetratricopeptide (TPR) repeat protein
VTNLVSRAVRAASVLALLLPMAGQAQTVSGAYLAGRHAVMESDFAAVAEYHTRALEFDPDNPALMESRIVALLALGRADEAAPGAHRMEAMGLNSQVAHMIAVSDLIARGEYATLLSREDSPTQGIGPLIDGLIRAWAHVGAGSVSEALDQFDLVAEERGLRGFALYHKAMALASVGDFEGAEAVFSGDAGQQAVITRRAVLARAEILSQLGRNDDALAVVADAFTGADPVMTAMADRLAGGETVAFSQVTSVRDGMAEVFFTIGAALHGEAGDDYTLLYARLAAFLNPGLIDAQLLSAQLLDGLGQYDLAVETYKTVPQDSPDRFSAELGRAEALRRAAKPNAAIEVLDRLALDFPQQPQVHSALGDLLRQEERYGDAILAYDRALQFTEDQAPSQWALLYARGICHERLKDWTRSEADFRAALALNPDQPQVLNYLGYSMVERQVHLDEALEMIERAVRTRPDSGYIVDSLGWVLFRLGRYDDAVGHLERAVELMPVDPVVNDHLGDVYWAVGRYREAEFQWKRALSFIDPTDSDSEADPLRIRRKLDLGLDQVLADEGAAPLVKIANGDD